MDKTKKMNPLMLAVIAACIGLPFVFMGAPFILLILCYIEIYIIAVSGLDIVFGYCGQISLGHAAFYAIGAYGSVLLHKYYNVPVFFSMLIGAAIGAVIGAIVAYTCSNLVFHFLSLATQAVGEIVYILISHSPGNITGNFVGMYTDSVSIFGFKLDNQFKFYWFGLVCVLIFLALKQALINSRTGRAFMAIRENVKAADGMGIDVRMYKVKAFAMSAFYTAFAGALVTHMTKYASPDSFLYKQSVMFLTMLLFGGTGSLWGPIVGSISVLVINESLRDLQNLQMLVFGVLMLIVIIAIPGGIYGTAKEYYDNLKAKKSAGKTDAGTAVSEKKGV